MPRRRERTTNKGKWNEETLFNAVKAVNENSMSIRQAGKIYKIPFSTLRERVKTGIITNPKLGGNTVFTSAQEKAMAEEIKTLAQLFYGLTPLQIRSAAYYFAEQNNIHNKFNKQTKLAGKDWLYNFLKRNNMAVRKPEPTSINRVISFNESDVNIFFDNLEILYTKYNFPASRIWNMDETGISNVQQPENIVAEKGQRRVASIVTAERGKNVTLICAMSAAGNFIPPMFIFPCQRMKDTLSKNGPVGAIYKCSPNGWSNTELFLLWLYHFRNYVGCTIDNPVLLILDNHVSHISLNSYNYCRENGIIMLSLVPHTSHRLQPLDVCFFGPFKAAYRKECDAFLKKEALQKILHDHLRPAEIVNKAYCKVASIEKGVSGFKSTGIYPLDRQVFSKQDFVAANALLQIEVEKRYQQKLNLIEDSCISPALEIPKQTENIINIEELPILSSNCTINNINDSSYVSLSSTPVVENNIILNNTNKTLSEPKEAVIMSSTNTYNRNTSNVELSHFSLQTKKILPQSNIRRSRKQKSVILTSSPLKEQLEEKERKRKIKLEKIENKENMFKCKKMKQEKKDATTKDKEISKQNEKKKKKMLKTNDKEKVSKTKQRKKETEKTAFIKTKT